MSKHKLSITGIDCANCAANLERAIAKVEGLENVSINFMTEKLSFDCDDSTYELMIAKIKEVISKVEPDAVLGEEKIKHSHHEHKHEEHHHEHNEECDCGHEHHEHEEHHHTHKYTKVKAEITDIDCPHCAGKLKGAIENLHGMRDVSINHIRERLMFTCPAGCVDEALEMIKHTIEEVLPEANLGTVLSTEDFEEECHGHHGEEQSHEEHHHEHSEECDCGHEHHEHEEHHHTHKYTKVKAEITDIDCPHCAGKLKGAIENLHGMRDVSINHIRERLMFTCPAGCVDEALEMIKHTIEEVLPEANLGAVLSTEDFEEECHGHHDEEQSHEHNHEEHSHEEHHHEHSDEHTHTHTEEPAGRKHKMSITGIDCANCAAALERQIAKINGLENVSINFMQEKLMFECDPEKYDELMAEMKQVISRNEPDAVLGADEMKKAHSHGHNHEHTHTHTEEPAGRKHKMSITGIDCANCAAALERQIAKINGLENVSINFMQEKLMFECDPEKYDELMAEMKQVISRNEPDAVLGADEMKKAHNHEHSHEHRHEHGDNCDCGHDHDDEVDESGKVHSGAYQYSIKGLDCANCAAALERKLAEIDSLDNVTITFMNETLSFDVKSGSLADSIAKINKVIADNEPDCYIEEKAAKAKKIVNKPEHKKEKHRILSSIILLIIAAVLKKVLPDGIVNFIVSGLFYMASYIIVGAPVLKAAFKNLGKGQWMDEKFLMAIATVGAIGTGEFQEGVFVMLLYQIGELFQAMAVENSRQSITELMDIRADEANLKINGRIEKVDVEEVEVGDIIVIRPGEKVPLDGVILSGTSSLNTAALTGESLPRDVAPGDRVISGCVNVQGLLEVKVTKESSESTVSKILDLVENSSNRKANTENFISTFAKYYTPIVVYLALFVSFIVPGILAAVTHVSYFSLLGDFFHRGLMFLVVSCPCAIVISVPLTYFSGIGGLSKKGILVKGSNYLDALNNVDTIVFDKTGTITKGQFSIAKVENVIEKDELIRLAAYAEVNSTHPISKVIVDAYGKNNIKTSAISTVKEIAGHGVEAVIEGKEVLAGNAKLMAMHGVEAPAVDEAGTVVFVAVNDKYAGYLVIADEIKETSAQAMAECKANGIKKTVMLTGDNAKAAKAIAAQCGIDEVKSDLLPQDKVEEFDRIAKTGTCAYVGDGINDAPVLAMANVGLAMGGLGSDAAIEAADIVIMNDDLMLIAEAVKGAKKTRKIVMQNIVFSLAVKVLILLASAFGITTSMAVAIFGDVGVMLIAVLNAIRALN